MDIGDQVCVISIEGKILDGYIFKELKLHNAKVAKGDIDIIVNVNRLLPSHAAGKALVASPSGIEVNKYNAVCPFCGYINCVNMEDQSSVFKCHGEIDLYWIDRTINKAKKPQKAAKMKAEPIVVDFEELKKVGELWTKSQIKFDDPNTDVKAHVLIIADDKPRKLCFNTYNGTLGKKGNKLPLEDFANGTSTSKITWYNIKNIDSARKTLQEDGFQLQ